MNNNQQLTAPIPNAGLRWIKTASCFYKVSGGWTDFNMMSALGIAAGR
jgi:hypothetical protein